MSQKAMQILLDLRMQAGMICIQLLMIRGGQVLGSRSYFPSVPAHSAAEEIIAAFFTQHYLTHPSHIEIFPSKLLLIMTLPEQSIA